MTMIHTKIKFVIDLCQQKWQIQKNPISISNLIEYGPNPIEVSKVTVYTVVNHNTWLTVIPLTKYGKDILRLQLGPVVVAITRQRKEGLKVIHLNIYCRILYVDL
jgi:hypothetical protein